MSNEKAGLPAPIRNGYCVYRLISKRTGRIYVGATCDLRARMRKRFVYQTARDAHFGAADDWFLDVLSVHADGASAAVAEVWGQLAIPHGIRVNRVISSNIPAGPRERAWLLSPGEYPLALIVAPRRTNRSAK